LRLLVSILYEVNRFCNLRGGRRQDGAGQVSILYEVSRFCNEVLGRITHAMEEFQSSTRLVAFATLPRAVGVFERAFVSILYEVSRFCNSSGGGDELGGGFVSILYEVNRFCNHAHHHRAVWPLFVSILYEVNRFCNSSPATPRRTWAVSILYEVNRFCNSGFCGRPLRVR